MNLKKIGMFGLIAASAVILAACTKNNAIPSNSTNSGGDKSSAAEQKSSDAMAAGTITYADSGFSPASLTVKVGETITVKNTGTTPVSFNSDPHPQHTSFPELNLGRIGPGESKTVTLSSAKTYTYHNHLNPSQRGTIVVQ